MPSSIGWVFPVVTLVAAGCFPEVPTGTRDAIRERIKAIDVAAGVKADGGIADTSVSVHDAARVETLPPCPGTMRDAAATDVAAEATAAADAVTMPETAGPVDVGTTEETSAPAARAPVPGEVVITELMVNPAGTDLGREWIEIRSLAAVPVNLAELHVADRLSEAPAAGGELGPGQLLVLGQSLDPLKNGGAPVVVTFATAVSLNNDGDSIALCLGPCANGVVLDRYTYGPLGSSYDGFSLMLPATADPMRAGCPGREPFGTAGSHGTPGAMNPVCPP